MIRVRRVCDRDGQTFKLQPRTVPVRKAASILMLAEIAWGGSVEEVKPRLIRTRSSVMDCVDRFTFVGPIREMAVLHNCLDLYFSAHRNPEVRESGIARACRATGGNPRALSIVGAPLAFGRLAKVCYLAGIGITDPGELKAALAVPDEDLDTVLDLRFEENVSVTEIVA